MRHLHYITLIIASIATIAVGCKKDSAKNTVLTTAQQEYSVGVEESTLKIDVVHNTDFDFEIEATATEWIEPIETRAKKVSNTTTTLEFKIAANEQPEQRTATIRIKTSNGLKEITVTVTQQQRDAIEADEEYVVDYTSQQLTIDVASNTSFDTEIEFDETAKEWLRVADSRAMEQSALTFDVDENILSVKRTGYVKLISKDITHTITVTQGAAPNYITLGISHRATQLNTPVWCGIDILGEILWGDNESEEWSDKASHTYADETLKEATFEMVGTDMFIIHELNDIESFTITYN